jgi:broad specificity phosphatase PhoE
MLHDLNFSLFLIRHGESEVNILPDHLGQSPDTPLTSNGEKQAFLLRKHFEYKNIHFDRIYASPYNRAWTTAEIATEPGTIIQSVPELREYSAGDWAGKSRKETINDSMYLKMGYLNNSFLPPNGESLNMVERRVSEWFEKEILYNKFVANHYKGKYDNHFNIALFSHGMTIKAFLHYVIGFDKNFTWKINIDNTSVTKLSFDHRGWFVNSINDCSHL